MKAETKTKPPQDSSLQQCMRGRTMPSELTEYFRV